MASPFNIFRKNQRVMMAALVGMSMFAFIFFDPSMLRSGGLPKPLVILLAAGVCGIGMWFVGQRHGKSSEWGSIAALLGAVAAFFYVKTPETDPAVRTKIGAFTDQDLAVLGRKRYQANQFVFMAGEKTKAKPQSRGFGPTDNRSMLQFKLGEREAKRLGISLNAEAVNRFIKEITDDRLSVQQFSEILKEIQISQGELFNILQRELEVRLALEVQVPPYESWLDFHPQTFQMFPRFMLAATPDEAWRNFERLNVKQSLSAVALPVDAFVKTLEDPPEAELKTFFEARKTFRPSAQGEPGFVQPARVRLAYLAADFEKFESQAKAPTDDEITEYYEQNLERFRIREIPDLPGDNDPADAGSPENVLPELPALKLPESREPEKKDGEATPDEKKPDEKKEDAKKEEPKPDEKKPDGEESSAVKSPATIRLAAFVQESEVQPASETADFPDDQPVSAEDAISGSSVQDPFVVPPTPTGKPPEKPARYRPLDDDLRDQIREQMLNDRAFEKMGAALDAAAEEMSKLSYSYLDADEKGKPAAAKSIADAMQAYATEHGLEYIETELFSEIELQTSSKEDIGKAVLPEAGGMQMQSRTVSDDVFPPGGQQSPLYFPQRADSRLREKRYAWWKIEDKPQHVPAWTNEGIPDQVKAAWKYDKGRALAPARAEELQKLAETGGTDLAKAFAGQTVTGKAGTASVVVKETSRFSWLTTASSVPFDNDLSSFFATPRLSFIDGIDQPSNDFMKVVFAGLKPGETGVAANAQRSVFYVVQPKEHSDGTEPEADVDGFQTVDELRKKFLTLHASERREFAARPYNLLMTDAFARLQQQWAKSFDERYGVEMDDPEGTPAGAQQ